MDSLILRLVAEHGPWALLVFYLLYREVEKDRIARTVIEKNSLILTELATIIKERLPAR